MFEDNFLLLRYMIKTFIICTSYIRLSFPHSFCCMLLHFSCLQ